MKIICVGRNYVDHAKELNNAVPKKPMLFMKPSTALLHKEHPFFYPDFSENIHYEAEIVLKIKKNGKHIDENFALDYFDEITVGLDMTARDIQSQCKAKGHPWEIAKAFDNSAIIGEFVPAKDFDPNNVAFSLKRNGEIVQQGNTADLIFSFAHLISYISRFFKLQIGDLIFTGTPAGVGPVEKGDTLEGFIGDQQLLNCRIK
ncbi:MAG: fumarylacetoacetate hydrolase family protein [Bacteroidota bacterium]